MSEAFTTQASHCHTACMCTSSMLANDDGSARALLLPAAEAALSVVGAADAIVNRSCVVNVVREQTALGKGRRWFVGVCGCGW